MPASPFSRPGLAVRAAPFAAVAIVAEASVAFPPGPRSGWALGVSVALLLVVGAAFALPWSRLPAWLQVAVPLASTGSMLALILAAGATSGVGIVLLIPLVWTALFQRRWESGCILIAILVVEVTISLTPVAVPGAVLTRRVVLWAALGAVISVATHGLRDRVRRSREETAALQDKLRELSILEDRERIADDLKDRVIQRIFAAGLTLQGAATRTSQPEVRRRVDMAVQDLDQAVRTLRETIFGLDRRLAERGLRQEILGLCRGLTPAPEISFTGPVDGALSPGSRVQLLEQLRRLLEAARQHAALARVEIVVGDDSCLAAIETASPPGVAAAPGGAPELTGIRDTAAEVGVRLEISAVATGTRLAWHVPLDPSGPGGLGG
jgi:hypothetical protein